jgi:hypothetical protein
VVSYGVYSRWDCTSRELPIIQQFTTNIEAVPDNEFGMVVNIKGARGKWIDYCIDHPPFKDNRGKVTPPFKGNYRIKTKDYDFFIGDSIWAPVEDKMGEWTITLMFEDRVVIEKSFEVVPVKKSH